jgi:dsRNA-specific ribonuclease
MRASHALVKEEGPEHKKTFTVEVRLPEAEVDDFWRARGGSNGRNGRSREAARQVLERLSTSPEWRERAPGRICRSA